MWCRLRMMRREGSPRHGTFLFARPGAGSAPVQTVHRHQHDYQLINSATQTDEGMERCNMGFGVLSIPELSTPAAAI